MREASTAMLAMSWIKAGWVRDLSADNNGKESQCS
jgi:hypothetical protein